MAKSGQEAEKTIRSFLKRMKKSTDGVGKDTALFADGIGLDSLETAELSAILEDELGSDPFSSGDMPQTFGEVVAYYDEAGDT